MCFLYFEHLYIYIGFCFIGLLIIVMLFIDECNDKFNWLEERYKEERKGQELINSNHSQAIKNQAATVNKFYLPLFILFELDYKC